MKSWSSSALLWHWNRFRTRRQMVANVSCYWNGYSNCLFCCRGTLRYRPLWMILVTSVYTRCSSCTVQCEKLSHAVRPLSSSDRVPPHSLSRSRSMSGACHNPGPINLYFVYDIYPWLPDISSNSYVNSDPARNSAVLAGSPVVMSVSLQIVAS